MSQHRVLEVPKNQPLDEMLEARQCPLSHRVARRVSTAIIVVLCVAIVVVFFVLLRQGA